MAIIVIRYDATSFSYTNFNQNTIGYQNWSDRTISSQLQNLNERYQLVPCQVILNRVQVT